MRIEAFRLVLCYADWLGADSGCTDGRLQILTLWQAVDDDGLLAKRLVVLYVRGILADARKLILGRRTQDEPKFAFFRSV